MTYSEESEEGTFPREDWSCSSLNITGTCNTFGQECLGISSNPNATIDENGQILGANAVMVERDSRGPISCVIDAVHIMNYTSGVFFF